MIFVSAGLRFCKYDNYDQASNIYNQACPAFDDSYLWMKILGLRFLQQSYLTFSTSSTSDTMVFPMYV
jgi:hypothetical protein